MELLAGKLFTPKSRLNYNGPLTKREPLISSTQLWAIRAEYAQSLQGFEDSIKAATRVGDLVRQTIDFAAVQKNSSTLTAENIAQSEATNCYGYAIVTSECLEEVGVEHYIAYANQHAFVMLFDRQSERSFMVDTPTEALQLDTTLAVIGEDPLNQLARGELRAINQLQTSELLKKLPASVNRDIFVSSRPWLNFAPVDSWRYREGNQFDSLLQLLTYPSIPGRELLRRQYNISLQLLQDDVIAAYNTIADLPGIYPDTDPRNKLTEVHKIRKRLVVSGLGQQAIYLSEVVKASLLPCDTSHNRFIVGDTLRMVAKYQNDEHMARRALTEYTARLFAPPDDSDVLLTSFYHGHHQQPVLSPGFVLLRNQKIQAVQRDIDLIRQKTKVA